MKRWKNLKFNSSGNAEPPSIGITLIAADKFEVYRTYDYLEEKWKYDDLEALIGFAKEIQNLFIFQGVSDNGRLLYRIKYPLPSSLNFEDDTDVFKKMTDIYMTDFKDKIDENILKYTRIYIHERPYKRKTIKTHTGICHSNIYGKYTPAHIQYS